MSADYSPEDEATFNARFPGFDKPFWERMIANGTHTPMRGARAVHVATLEVAAHMRKIRMLEAALPEETVARINKLWREENLNPK